MSHLFHFLLALALLTPVVSPAATYQYIRAGNKEDITKATIPGVAMMGGGEDLDDAFRWLCDKAGGGDFLVLRARGDDAYNSYINGLCKLNSVATLIIPSREAAQDPAVVDIIRHAEAIFIAGGDQSLYVNFWKETPVQNAINSAIENGKPLGGTSAGLAVQGEFVYGAMKDKPDDEDLSSAQTLVNPFFERVTLAREFLDVPELENTITDSHFAKRDRLGRTLVFLSRLMQDGWSKSPREVAVDEQSAVLVEKDGRATVVGPGRGAYFLHPTRVPEVCEAGKPLTFRDVSVYHAPRGGHFDLQSWTGEGGEGYSLSVKDGVIESSKADKSVY